MKKLYYLFFLYASLLSCVKKEIISPSFEKISEFKYANDSIQMKEGELRKSVLPTFKGSTPVSFQLTSVPVSDKITIDEQGVISTLENLTAGTYIVTVKAINPVETTTFKHVFTIQVNPATKTPINFFYTPNTISLIANTPYSSS